MYDDENSNMVVNGQNVKREIKSCACLERKEKPSVLVFTIMPAQPAPSQVPADVPQMAPTDWAPPEKNGRRRIVRQHQWETYNNFVDACCHSEPLFWSTIRDLTDPKPTKPDVSLQDLAAEFEKHAHIPDVLPLELDAVALELAALECSVIPSVTIDRTPKRSFSQHFILVEVRKVFTLLRDEPFREWMEDEGILPDSQNGFRRRFHGLNNPFILRCAIETALGAGKPLYVVLPDHTNAFPSTDHSSLWVMMYKHGAADPLFDWLCTMYPGMRYCVKMGNTLSTPFRSDIGILAGDGTLKHLGFRWVRLLPSPPPR
ncbi:uncharacterized protein EV420DRAFT_1755143 [Desarmillaria tabescens]|uniref:Reverse transcriptase domain-containing protein n=1 Tax=Armillaria tabescens TaxID=1929756 RepID=A0AA39IZW6_ARMTA|nr:uncharacterized protein EV420DRAFT_1755143 [Desarmillaria tabescens]KAK0432915.1 hypothetical protein EV420DRAFT_1755143 [Desarmillaria tabescens]